MVLDTPILIIMLLVILCVYNPAHWRFTSSRGNGFGYAEHGTDPLYFGGLQRAEFWELRGAPRGVGIPSMPYKAPTLPSRNSWIYRHTFTFRDPWTAVFYVNHSIQMSRLRGKVLQWIRRSIIMYNNVIIYIYSIILLYYIYYFFEAPRHSKVDESEKSVPCVVVSWHYWLWCFHCWIQSSKCVRPEERNVLQPIATTLKQAEWLGSITCGQLFRQPYSQYVPSLSPTVKPVHCTPTTHHFTNDYMQCALRHLWF